MHSFGFNFALTLCSETGVGEYMQAQCCLCEFAVVNEIIMHVITIRAAKSVSRSIREAVPVAN